MVYRFIIWTLILGSFSIACSPIKTFTEAPTEQEVNHYKTFAFMPVEEAKMDQASLILFDEVRKSISGQLRQKNYQPNTENPELLIAFNIMTDEQRKEVTKSSDPYGGRMWPYYSPYYRGWFPQDRYRYKEIKIEKTGTMVIDLFDNQKRELVWRGIGTGPVNNPEERFETAYRIVDKMFREFPVSTAAPLSAAN